MADPILIQVMDAVVAQLKLIGTGEVPGVTWSAGAVPQLVKRGGDPTVVSNGPFPAILVDAKYVTSAVTDLPTGQRRDFIVAVYAVMLADRDGQLQAHQLLEDIQNALAVNPQPGPLLTLGGWLFVSGAGEAWVNGNLAVATAECGGNLRWH